MNPKRPIHTEDVEQRNKICLANLWAFGYLDDPEPTGAQLGEAVEQYQLFFGDDLKIDGELGDVTATHIMRPRCSVPDMSRADATLSQWPRSCMRDITTSHRLRLTGMTDQQVHLVWLDCLRLINAVCGAHASYQLEMDTARIWADDGKTESNVLAWSYLPSSCGQRLEQRYGTRWTWTERKFREVALHELGHALGLSHDNSKASIMYPSAITGFQSYQPRDIAQLQKRYGPNTDDPTEPDPPIPPSGRRVLSTWQMDGRKFEVAEILGSNNSEWGM